MFVSPACFLTIIIIIIMQEQQPRPPADPESGRPRRPRRVRKMSQVSPDIEVQENAISQQQQQPIPPPRSSLRASSPSSPTSPLHNNPAFPISLRSKKWNRNSPEEIVSLTIHRTDALAMKSRPYTNLLVRTSLVGKLLFILHSCPVLTDRCSNR